MAVGAVFDTTVRVALLLVALPKAFVTTARNCAPLSEGWAFETVYDDEVAPLMGAPLRCHWYASGGVPEAPTVNVAAPPTDRLVRGLLRDLRRLVARE